MRTIERSTAFRRDYKRFRASPRRRELEARLNAILELLASDQALPAADRDHALSGSWAGYRECHVRPDLLLIYRKQGADVLRLARLGSHSDLFG